MVSHITWRAHHFTPPLPHTLRLHPPPDLTLPLSQRVEEHDSTEGRGGARPHDVEQAAGEGNMAEMKSFLKEAQQVREKIVMIESLVTQIKACHQTITGEAARNEGKLEGNEAWNVQGGP